LEKIEMKKTLVAVAAMAAVTGAMAQATISGMIDGAYTTNKATTAANVSTSTSSVGSGAAGQSQISIKSSEDLGGGMKAFGALRINPNPYSAGNVAATNLAQDVSEVGISGDFGTVLLNRDYGIAFDVHASADASGWTSGAKGVVHNTGTGISNGVVYVLPTFVQGLDALVAKGVSGTAGGDGDAIAYRLKYTTGGLMVQYAGASVNNIAAGTWATNFTTGGTTATTEATAANAKASLTALAVTYDLGMAKLHYGKFSAKSGGDTDQKSSSDMMGVSIPFGATTVGITSSSAKRTIAAATTVKASGYRGKVAYALSKRTTAYAAYGTEKVSNTTQSDKQTTIGLTHGF